MRNISHVFWFEYLNAVKLKSFIVTTSIIAVMSVVLAFLPQVLGVAEQVIDSHWGPETWKTLDIAVIDDTDLFSDEVLHAHMNARFHRQHTHAETIIAGLEAGDYDLGIQFLTPTAYVLLFEHVIGGPVYQGTIEDMVRTQYVEASFGQVGLDALGVSVSEQLVPVGGGGFEVGYFIAFAMFLLIQMFAGGVGIEIVQEKTTKVVEILFTSASPHEIVLGKVLAYIGVTVTLLVAGFTPYLLVSMITDGNAVAGMLTPEVLGVFSPLVIGALIGFFFIYLITMIFLYAVFAATAKDAQEAQQVQGIPGMLHLVNFFLAVFGVGMGWLSDTLLNILGLVPIIAPMSMVVRMTSLSVSDGYILASLAANVVYMIGFAVLATWLYAHFIMYNGAKPFRNLLKGKA